MTSGQRSQCCPQRVPALLPDILPQTGQCGFLLGLEPLDHCLACGEWHRGINHANAARHMGDDALFG